MNAKDMKRALDELVARSRGVENGKLLQEISEDSNLSIFEQQTDQFQGAVIQKIFIPPKTPQIRLHIGGFKVAAFADDVGYIPYQTPGFTGTRLPAAQTL